MPRAQGDAVFLPNQLVGRGSRETAVGRFEIAEVGASSHSKHSRSVRVTLDPDESVDDGWVASSLVHDHLDIGLVRIGDLSSEAALLDPLAKSLGQFFRLLVGDDYFRTAYVRTRPELNQFLTSRPGLSHLVLIAHGRPDGLRLIGDSPSAGFADWIPGAEAAGLLPDAKTPGTHLLSLACHTGKAAFSKPASTATRVRTVVAPIDSLHGAIASQFTQTAFTEHLLHGRTWPVAIRRAKSATPGTSSFRLWSDGHLLKGATS